jgi:cytidylate kinase
VGPATGPATPPPAEVAAVLPRDLVIAIDGPASSGKSTVGAAVARALGYRFLDTGLLYRAVTLLALERGVSTNDPDGLARLVSEIELAAGPDGRLDRVWAEGREVTAQLRSPKVEAHVSEVARVGALRTALLGYQRALVGGGGIVVAGRDIGTVVLPDADVKIFLSASVGERARRRALERRVDPAGPAGAAIRAQLEVRDTIDRERAVAPLRPASDAIVLDTDGNAFEETVRQVLDRIVAAVTTRQREGVTTPLPPVAAGRGNVATPAGGEPSGEPVAAPAGGEGPASSAGGEPSGDPGAPGAPVATAGP